MPTYQYACTECHDQFEVVQKFTDDALTECPHCSGTPAQGVLRRRRRVQGLGLLPHRQPVLEPRRQRAPRRRARRLGGGSVVRRLGRRRLRRLGASGRRSGADGRRAPAPATPARSSGCRPTDVRSTAASTAAAVHSRDAGRTRRRVPCLASRACRPAPLAPPCAARSRRAARARLRWYRRPVAAALAVLALLARASRARRHRPPDASPSLVAARDLDAGRGARSRRPARGRAAAPTSPDRRARRADRAVGRVVALPVRARRDRSPTSALRRPGAARRRSAARTSSPRRCASATTPPTALAPRRRPGRRPRRGRVRQRRAPSRAGARVLVAPPRRGPRRRSRPARGGDVARRRGAAATTRLLALRRGGRTRARPSSCGRDRAARRSTGSTLSDDRIRLTARRPSCSRDFATSSCAATSSTSPSRSSSAPRSPPSSTPCSTGSSTR